MDASLVANINKAAVKFLMPLTPEETYETIVREAIKLINADFGSILLNMQGELKRVYGSAPFLYTVKNRKGANTYKAYKDQETVVAYITEIGKAHPQLVAHKVHHTVFIPLSYEEKSFGVLTINNCKDVTYNQKELDLFKLYGSLATMAIRKTQLYSETQKTLEMRDFFIALSAQELRTPLTTINGYIKLLQRKLVNPDTSEYKWIMKLCEESEKLTYVVHELLEINKIKAGKIEYAFQQCNVENIINKALEKVKKHYPKHIFRVDNFFTPTNHAIIGDEEKLLQVVFDVLDNAAKYSPENKEITITLQNNLSKVSIIIKDQGKGIHKKDLPYIFEGFYKPDYNQEHGLVVGLFIAKNIIERHNGTIRIKSRKDHGTIVEIKLPIVKI